MESNFILFSNDNSLDSVRLLIQNDGEFEVLRQKSDSVNLFAVFRFVCDKLFSAQIAHRPSFAHQIMLKMQIFAVS